MMTKTPKRRNAHAVDAWSRHGGAHDPGTRRPDIDDTDEQVEEYVLDIVGTIEIDGELYEVEFSLDEGDEDDEEE
jgi:hypothetical protein